VGDSERHVSPEKASLAAPTARSTSAASAAAISAQTAPVVGLTDSSVRPDIAGSSLPPMRSPYESRSVVVALRVDHLLASSPQR
jgi:hypothetical protein